MKDMSMWSRVDLESDLDDFKDQEDAEDLCGQNVILLQSILCYVRCSTSSVTFEFIAMSLYHISKIVTWYKKQHCQGTNLGDIPLVHTRVHDTWAYHTTLHESDPKPVSFVYIF